MSTPRVTVSVEVPRASTLCDEVYPNKHAKDGTTVYLCPNRYSLAETRNQLRANGIRFSTRTRALKVANTTIQIACVVVEGGAS